MSRKRSAFPSSASRSAVASGMSLSWRIEFVFNDRDGEVSHAIGVGPFQRVGDAEKGGQFADADAVFG